MTKEEAKECFKNLKCWSENDVFKIIDSIDEKPFTFKEQLLLNITNGIGVQLANHSSLYVAEQILVVANKIEKSLKNESNA